MFGEEDPKFQSLQIKSCTSRLIVKTIIKQEWNFEFTLWKFVGLVNQSFANSHATMIQTSVGDIVRNLWIE